MINRNKKNNKGFTLVELLVVIAIIGILAVVAVPSLFKNIDKAKAVQVVTNVNALKTEIMSKYADGSTYAEIADTSETTKSTLETSILEVVTDIKASETYNLQSTSTGVNIIVSTTATSKVLGSAGEKLGLTITDGTSAKLVIPVIK